MSDAPFVLLRKEIYDYSHILNTAGAHLQEIRCRIVSEATHYRVIFDMQSKAYTFLDFMDELNQHTFLHLHQRRSNHVVETLVAGVVTKLTKGL